METEHETNALASGMTSSANPLQIAIIGCGAAGLMAAVFAARTGAQTLVLDRTKDGGRKILVSGGGRCNILPSILKETRFVTDSSLNSMRKMLRAWPLAEQIAFFENDLHLPLVEEAETAKLFPASQKARDVRDRLIEEARSHGAHFRFDSLVTELAPVNAKWRVSLENGETTEFDRVIIATGGLSIPTTGSDGSGFAFARQLGIPLRPTYAALTPVTTDAELFTSLSGITLRVQITARDGHRSADAEDSFLFTHRGYSGPAVLDVSHVIARACDEGRRDAQLLVRWKPYNEDDWTSMFNRDGSSTVMALLHRELPDRLAAALCVHADVPAERKFAQLRRDERRRLLDVLCQCALPWNGHEGYRKAEVTGGGVGLEAVHPKTMESRAHPGLHFCGEVLDVFGPIGGYNFYWAWATGRAAGLGAAMKRD